MNYDSTFYEIDKENIIHCIQKISDIKDKNEKLNIIRDNYTNIQYLYYENIYSYNIDIKTRLKFSNAMIFCDTFTTLGYNTQNWNFLKYIPYVSTIQSINILHKPPKILSKSTIWSSYSNLSSKINKINLLLTNPLFMYNYKILKYIQTLLIKYLNTLNINEFENICNKYNINDYQTINNILQIGLIKKQNLKNINLIKHINK